MGRFNFCGEVSISKKNDSFLKEMKTKNGDKMLSMSFGVKESKNNTAFVEAVGVKSSIINTINTENEKIKVDWDDRFDEDIISSVANFRKNIIDLGEEYGGRQEFITQYDMIKYLHETLPKYKGRVIIVGDYNRVWGAKSQKYYDKFRIQNIYAAPDERKSRLGVSTILYYKRDFFDDSDIKETKKATLNCYMPQYISEDEETKYVEFLTTFSVANYNFDEESHKKRFEYRMKYIKPNNDDMVSMLWDLVLLRGAEEVEFDESMLTDAQKEQVELGIKTVDDFRPGGSTWGERINEFRLLDPILKGDYENGLVKVDDMEDFEDNIFIPEVDETLEEAKEKSKKDSKSEKKSSKKDKKEVIDADDIF